MITLGIATKLNRGLVKYQEIAPDRENSHEGEFILLRQAVFTFFKNVV